MCPYCVYISKRFLVCFFFIGFSYLSPKEAKLSELSDVVGKYERLRSHDQMEIQKLKERLHVLNTTNMESVNTDNRDSGNIGDNENDVDEVFRKVRELLRSRNSQNNEDILESGLSSYLTQY